MRGLDCLIYGLDCLIRAMLAFTVLCAA